MTAYLLQYSIALITMLYKPLQIEVEISVVYVFVKNTHSNELSHKQEQNYTPAIQLVIRRQLIRKKHEKAEFSMG